MAEFSVVSQETSTESKNNNTFSLQFLETIHMPVDFLKTKEQEELEVYTNNLLNEHLLKLFVDAKVFILGEKKLEEVDEIEISCCIKQNEKDRLFEILQKDLNIKQWIRFKKIFTATSGKILLSFENLFKTFGSEGNGCTKIFSRLGMTTKDAMSKLIERRTLYFNDLVMKMPFQPIPFNDDWEVLSSGHQNTLLYEVD